MFFKSSFPFTEEILATELKIDNPAVRQRLILKLSEGKNIK